MSKCMCVCACVRVCERRAYARTTTCMFIYACLHAIFQTSLELLCVLHTVETKVYDNIPLKIQL